MKINQIRELAQILDESSLTELSVKEGDTEVTLKKETAVTKVVSAAEMPATAREAVISAGKQTVEGAAAANSGADDEYFLSPMVGTFYASPSEGADNFVKAGDVVKKGQTVCIIEAMKLMNEIESECDMQIVEVLACNEQKVEYDQPLFKIKKL